MRRGDSKSPSLCVVQKEDKLPQAKHHVKGLWQLSCLNFHRSYCLFACEQSQPASFPHRSAQPHPFSLSESNFLIFLTSLQIMYIRSLTFDLCPSVLYIYSAIHWSLVHKTSALRVRMLILPKKSQLKRTKLANL